MRNSELLISNIFSRFRYMYSGKVFLEGIEVPTIMDILDAADELILEELVDYLQDYLIEFNTETLMQNFALIYHNSFQHTSFMKLQDFCTTMVAIYPELIFKSDDFTSLKETALLSLLG